MKNILVTFCFFICVNSYAQDPIIIGLDADMSAVAKEGGISIQRGAEIAIEEINKQGGVLNRPLKLMIKNHRGNPARGIDNIQKFSKIKDLVAVIGGVHTPVALRELPILHQHKMIYLDPWAAGTPIVDNGYKPNFVFRISIRDAEAAKVMIPSARQQGVKSVGLLLERTGWGRSNEKSLTVAAAKNNINIAQIAWFNWGQKEFKSEVK
jgi:branched-chain amino acid transport system substrate-binding protein